MQTVVIIIHLILAVALVIIVLLQQSEGGALGIGGNAGFMTGRGAANVLTRATAILAALFFGTSIILTIMARSTVEQPSILDSAPAASEPAPQPEIPAVPKSQ